MSANIYHLKPTLSKESMRVKESLESRGLRAISWEISEKMSRALEQYQEPFGVPRTNIISNSCRMLYSGRALLQGFKPYSLAPRSSRTIKTTWYAPRDLHRTMRRLALDLDCTLQDLIDTAVDSVYPLHVN